METTLSWHNKISPFWQLFSILLSNSGGISLNFQYMSELAQL